MNKCLNCGNSVKNKYCGVSCQNKHQKRQFTPEQRKKIAETRLSKWKTFSVNCFKCNIIFDIKEYDVEKPKKEKYYCSRKCANSRIFSEETIKLKSESAKKSDKVKIANKIQSTNEQRNLKISIALSKNKNSMKIRSPKKCLVCNENIIQKYNRLNQKYHQKCWLTISGGFRQGSSRGKSGWYKGYWCDSSYELAWVMYALDNNISFTRNKQGFNYVYNNESHLFYPDFILEDGSYLEIKNFHSDLTDAKISQFPNKIEVWYKNEMKYYIEYAKEKYGKDYIRLYEINHPAQ